jgi:mannose-6-phosphate isomerase-like protein (cupin superfamily)
MPRPAEYAAVALAGRTLGDPDASFVVAEWTEPGAPPGEPRLVAPLHVHHADDELWYVLEGALAFRIGDETIEARAGEAVLGPRGVPHTFWNPAAEAARYLLVMTPATFRLIEAIHAADRDLETMRALYREHGCELV